MTDEQWLWVYVNMALDNDETLDGMCYKCRDEATSDDKCTRCGTKISNMESHVNPNFDRSRFEELDNDTHTNTSFDKEAFNRLKDGGD